MFSIVPIRAGQRERERERERESERERERLNDLKLLVFPAPVWNLDRIN